MVCPVADNSELSGVGIFDATMEETRKLVDEDPGIKAGIVSYEAHTGRVLPGSRLPD